MYFEDIIRLRFEEKLSYNEISEKLGCSKSTISFHCNKFKENLNLTSKNREKIKIEFDDSIKEKIKQYYNEGVTIPVLSAFLKVDESQLKSFISKNNLVRPVTTSGYTKLKRYRRQMKALSIEYLGGKCSKCGYSKCIGALDFHHINPSDKSFAISKSYRKWRDVMNELDKCTILCANCHRELHYMQSDASG